MWSCLPNQPSHVTYILVFDSPGSRDLRGSLLTLPAPALPLVCRTNESAALVLLPVSACSVVAAPGPPDPPDDLLVWALPHPDSQKTSPALARRIRAPFSGEGRRIGIMIGAPLWG